MSKITTDTGIVFYSRSGHSKRLAQRLNEELHGTLLEICAPTYEVPFFGYARAAYDSLRQRDMPISQPMPSVADFGRVIIRGPVWTSYPAVPLRTFMRAGLQGPKTIGLFLTHGGHSPAHKAFAAALVDLGRPFAAMGSVSNADEGSEQEGRIIASFLADLEDAVTLSVLD